MVDRAIWNLLAVNLNYIEELLLLMFSLFCEEREKEKKTIDIFASTCIINNPVCVSVSESTMHSGQLVLLSDTRQTINENRNISDTRVYFACMIQNRSENVSDGGKIFGGQNDCRHSNVVRLSLLDLLINILIRVKRLIEQQKQLVHRGSNGSIIDIMAVESAPHSIQFVMATFNL